MNDALYSFVSEPNSKRRDLLNLAIESIDLIQRTDSLKEIRERKSSVMESLKGEIAITEKSIKHFQGLMPFTVKEEEERIHEKIEKSKVKIVEKQKVEKLDSLSMELEDIKHKLNNLNF